MKSSNIRYLPQVDHLRGVAALWVLLYHGTHIFEGALSGKANILDQANWTYSRNPFWAMIYEGHTAVALFMVLSGFIFAYGAIGHRVHYWRFLGNRLLRIYPLYLSMILLSVILDPSRLTLLSFVSTVFPVADFQTFSGSSLVTLAWTIAVEFQFYLIFPFLLASLNQRPLKTALGILALSLSLRLVATAAGANPRDLSYWHLAGRIDQFVLGMGAAYLARSCESRRSLVRPIFWFSIPLSILGMYCFHLAGGWPVAANWKIIWPTIEGAMWGLMILGYVGGAIVLPQFASKSLARVGEISFSIYLLHFPIIVAISRYPKFLLSVSRRTEVSALVSTVCLALPCILVLSWITFHLIELPFLRKRQKYLYEESEHA
jgi:peptidoglycan/LPS O-acetylase OafA/YrhL